MNETEQTYHIPVLLEESIDGMNIQPGGIYVDMTFGGGGHSKEILRRMDKDSRLFSFDQDEDAERNIVNDERFTFVRSNFRYLHNFLRYYGVEKVDAILADLGVSSHHFDDSERGFSFRFDGNLDMRMNKRAGITAADIVNTYEEERLILLVRRTEEQPEAGCNPRKSTQQQEDRYHRRLSGYCQTALRTRKRKEGTGKGLSGTAHRSEPGNGSLERNALCGNRGSETGRPPVGHHLSFTGGPHREECHENRQRRRQIRSGLLRQRAVSFQTGKQQGDRSD